MTPSHLSFPLTDETETARLGALLAALLRPGDVVLLEGPIGAGKTHLARALIRARLGREEEVPSPSFTLVQTYEAEGSEIWHADLYRLGHPDEVYELGLEAAFETAICLVEWPDRLGSALPQDALHLRLAAEGEGRRVDLTGPARLVEPLRRDRLAADFVAAAGWGSATRVFLAGDASDRSYQRLTRAGGQAVLMDAPPGRGDDPADFVKIAGYLRRLGLSAPEVLAEDLPNGFLLLEDLGDAVFARVMAADPTRELPLALAAADVLAHLHRAAPPPGLPDLSAGGWAAAAAFALDWYGFAATGLRGDSGPFIRALAEALARHADGPRVVILRDFHAENLLWLPEREGLARVGLLDFQLAQMGQPGYDLVSLLQDARRDFSEPTVRAVTRHFIAATGAEAGPFETALAVLGAQRSLRILGIFARLCLVGGKPAYLALVPRVWRQLWQNLAHPALADVAAICRARLPDPSPALLDRIRSQCATHPKP